MPASAPDADPASRLRAALGADPPASVRSLPEEQLAALADLVADARVQQDRSLEESFNRTLKHVPFPVRKIVKKVLLG